MRYAFIEEHHGVWAVGLMADVLAVSVSGFYAWLRRGESKRAQDDEVLSAKIVMFHYRSRSTYGSPRIRKDLEAARAQGRAQALGPPDALGRHRGQDETEV